MRRISILSIFLAFLAASHTVALPWALPAADQSEANFLCADPKSSSGLLELLDPTGGALQKATCGGFTCSSTQVCIYCGNSATCRPQGDTCCYPGFCSASQQCIDCGGIRGCYARGSSCCGSVFTPSLICRPDQKCDNVTKQCVPR